MHWCAIKFLLFSLLLYHTYTKSTKHTTPPLSAPFAKHTHIPQTTFSTAHTYIPQATYWTSGCLPREWRPCWSGGRDAWQGFSRETGLSDPSTATRRRGRSITTTTSLQSFFVQNRIFELYGRNVHTGDRGILLSFPLVCFNSKISSIRL